ncbi:SseB family protein [Natronoglycomyces albus]|uniref:SseB family protein n=1 Tax=Natronoglycomyces albus TaxID=2811108 RepID=A0A895XNI7_9ACTN|nr:SseB family protein [Natronoglycomyces albus]QSB04949.1 SseB family protein [Natronoglycomyces albus]
MWEPSNETEHHLREALRAEDQDAYFQILSQMELILPLSQDDSHPSGSTDTWATWTDNERTHVLSFTSESAMQACLRGNAGPARRVRYDQLASAWPNEDWWLAVNPGLPIEGYLPAWFVAQVAHGDTSVPEENTGGEYADSSPEDFYGQPPAPSDGTAYEQAARSQGYPTDQQRGSFMPPAPDVPDVPSSPRRPERGGGLAGAFGKRSSAPNPADAAAPVGPSQTPVSSGTTEGGLPQRAPGANYHLGGEVPPPAEETANYDRSGYSSDTYPTVEDNYHSEAGEFASGYEDDSRYQPTDTGFDAYGHADQGAYGGGGYESPGSYRDTPGYESPTYDRPSYERPPAPAEVTSHAGENLTELSEEDAEATLAHAASQGDTAVFLHTLLRTFVYLPVADVNAVDIRVGDPAFRWASDVVDGHHGITVYTTVERLQSRQGDVPYVRVPFGWLCQHWPGQLYALYVNPGTEVGANMSGPEIKPLLTWAEAHGLLEFAAELEKRQAAAEAAAREASRRRPPQMWQKVVPHHQVGFFLERGYDRIAGFVHPVADVERLRTPAQLYLALGLLRGSDNFMPTDADVHVIRWMGYRADLYQPALGGNNFQDLEASGGWVIEAPPFRGDGFAASEDPDSNIPEYKVDSARLPHGAQMIKLSADGAVTHVASYDADTRSWRGESPSIGSGPASLDSNPVIPRQSEGDYSSSHLTSREWTGA